MRVYRIPYSTNVERVALALAHKSIPVDWVDVDPNDRSVVADLSGQDLVPVLEADHGEVVSDSMRIVAWLEKKRPDPPLWPAHPARHAEVDVFIEWFNRVWKVPPNAITSELERERPDEHALHDYGDEMRGWLHLFEDMLDGRDWLMGEAVGAADICAFPFLKYGVLGMPDNDDELFHRVLVDHLPITGAFPAIEAWVHRVDALPRA
ncbi:MAG TPA: glutathione S-transferase family protein [Solirubrobacteraceae bacterium]|nr:glutathione S-transferase family protein [Solirubrobacteraceae bacterium]